MRGLAPAVMKAERGLVLALCLAVGWFYFWTVRSTDEPLKFGREQRDYYNLLIDGYLAGQLNMKVDVPEVSATRCTRAWSLGFSTRCRRQLSNNQTSPAAMWTSSSPQ